MGLVVFGVMGLYLLISIGVVKGAIAYAREKGKSIKRWGWGAALVMYLIPFWDWIPTVAMHQYYCATEAGFWVYKTPEQWRKENPGVMEVLMANKGAPSERQGDMTNYADTNFLNSRFNWVVKHNGRFFPNRWRHEQEMVDSKMGQVLARYIDFSTAQGEYGGGWYGWKFWLHNPHCIGGERDASLFRQFKNNNFRGAEK